MRVGYLFLAIMFFVAGKGHAQQTLIDVPSLDIAEPKKLFFQEQAVFTKDDINTSTAVGLGLGHQFEIGVTVYQLVFQKAKGVEIDPTMPENNPDFLIAAQKAFDLQEGWKLGVGTRSGINAARSDQEIHFVNFDYVNSQFTFGDAEHRLIAGGYYGNDAYIGTGSNFGAMGAVDLVLVKNKFHFVGDFLSGSSSVSTINTGFEVELPNQWKVTLGAQFPFPGSDNAEGAVIQVSKN
jgi:hypothetical protein